MKRIQNNYSLRIHDAKLEQQQSQRRANYISQNNLQYDIDIVLGAKSIELVAIAHLFNTNIGTNSEKYYLNSYKKLLQEMIDMGMYERLTDDALIPYQYMPDEYKQLFSPMLPNPEELEEDTTEDDMTEELTDDIDDNTGINIKAVRKIKVEPNPVDTSTYTSTTDTPVEVPNPILATPSSFWGKLTAKDGYLDLGKIKISRHRLGATIFWGIISILSLGMLYSIVSNMLDTFMDITIGICLVIIGRCIYIHAYRRILTFRQMMQRQGRKEPQLYRWQAIVQVMCLIIALITVMFSMQFHRILVIENPTLFKSYTRVIGPINPFDAATRPTLRNIVIINAAEDNETVQGSVVPSILNGETESEIENAQGNIITGSIPEANISNTLLYYSTENGTILSYAYMGDFMWTLMFVLVGIMMLVTIVKTDEGPYFDQQ